jgi:hypothetical protein
LVVVDLTTKQTVNRKDFKRVKVTEDIERMCRQWAKQDPIQLQFIMDDKYPIHDQNQQQISMEDENGQQSNKFTEDFQSEEMKQLPSIPSEQRQLTTEPKGGHELRKNPTKATELTQSISKGWKRITRQKLNNSQQLNHVFSAFRTTKNSAFISFSAAMRANAPKTIGAVKLELEQMEDQKVYVPVYPKDVGGDVVLRSTMVMQKDKARLCGGGNDQDITSYKPSETAGPTGKIESFRILVTIAKQLDLKITTCDIKGAYLNADLPTERVIYMRLSKDVSKILIELKPEYKEYLTSTGQIVVRLFKAIYGLVESAVLWNRHITETLLSLGYNQYQYDSCVFSKRIDDKQTYIGLYVDDLLIVSNDEKERTMLLEGLTNKYGKLKTQSGPYIKYRGLEIQQGNEAIEMHQHTYINELLESENINKDMSSPTPRNLHEPSSTSEPVDQHKFTSLLAKVSWLSHQTRFDLKYIVSHLSKKAKSPTLKDQHNLHQVLRYLHKTKSDVLTFSKSNLKLSGWADASYLHSEDLRGQSGYIIKLGDNTIIAESQRQKTISQSSTEAELISLSACVNWMRWARNFMNELGFKQENIPIYQDNQSCIQIVELGRLTARTKHINIKLLNSSEEVKKKQMHLQYLETENMTADLLTKTMEPALFHKHKMKLLNIQRKEGSDDQFGGCVAINVMN